MKLSAEYAIEIMRVMELHVDKHVLILGSVSGAELPFTKYDQIDWIDKVSNVNYRFEEINNGTHNLIINLCCEHMYPMRVITLPATYLLQSNNRYCDEHVNRTTSKEALIEQSQLDEVNFASTTKFNGVNYYTIVGEKW